MIGGGGVAAEGWPFDFGFADVLCDDRARIVIFRCGCRWVWLMGRQPGAIFCKEHESCSFE